MTGTAHTETTQRSGPSAGGKLKAAREAAGLSVDAVAQQLKLAPRQVTALEEDDWHRLPGRTFVRGFARNYARFVQLDPDAVIALLPASDAAPALERPALAASRRPMGEIPVERAAKPSALRWIIPLVLVAALGVIGYRELSRSQLHLASLMSFIPGEARNASESEATTAPSDAPAGAGGTATSTLPNPVTGATSPSTPSAPVPAAAEPATANAVTVLPTPSATDSAAATAASPTTTPPSASAVVAEVPLVLTFKGTSWAEVKDAKGRVVLQMTGGAGMTQTVSAAPPIELALGNAPNVAVTFRGQSLDLSPYMRGNVARVALQ